MTTHAHPLFVEYLAKVSLELTTEEFTSLLNEARLVAHQVESDPKGQQCLVLGALIYLTRQERGLLTPTPKATEPEGPL